MINAPLVRNFCFSFLILSAACVGPVEAPLPEVLAPQGINTAGIQIITEDGGHLAWSKKTNQIAFDRLGEDGYFDLWVMNPDGSGQKCLTANHPLLPNKHIGQPAWHPGGKLLVIQAQKAHVPRYADTKCTPGAGALNDLWVITVDGSQAWRIYAVRDAVSKDAACSAVLASVPKGTEKMNETAFNKGCDYGLAVLKGREKKATGKTGVLA